MKQLFAVLAMFVFLAGSTSVMFAGNVDEPVTIEQSYNPNPVAPLVVADAVYVQPVAVVYEYAPAVVTANPDYNLFTVNDTGPELPDQLLYTLFTPTNTDPALKAHGNITSEGITRQHYRSTSTKPVRYMKRYGGDNYSASNWPAYRMRC